MFCEVMEMDYEDFYRGNDSSEKEGKNMELVYSRLS